MSAVENEAAAAAKRPKTEYVAVKMTDGTSVDFPRGRKLNKTSFWPGKEGYTGTRTYVRMDFANGEVREHDIPGAEIVGELMGSCTPEERARLAHLLHYACHGGEQVLGDEMAGDGGAAKRGEPEPTLEDKIEWVDEKAQRLSNLEWTTAREGGGGLAGAGVLVQALCALSGKSKDEMRTFLKSFTREERAVLKQTEPVKSKIDELEAARAKANGIDGNALLGKLGLAQGA